VRVVIITLSDKKADMFCIYNPYAHPPVSAEVAVSQPGLAFFLVIPETEITASVNI